VDRLLGFDRTFAESRLQLTPVEWGIWTFLILRALDTLDTQVSSERSKGLRASKSPGPEDLTLDRAGPDPFDASGLGSIVTARWSVRVGTTVGAVRLWIPESIVHVWLASPRAPAATSTDGNAGIDSETASGPGGRRPHGGELASLWWAEAGSVPMPQGLKRLRVGGVLPLTGSRLTGPPASPAGPVDLVLDLHGSGCRFRIPASPIPGSGGKLLRVEGAPLQEQEPRNPILVNAKERQSMSQPAASSTPSTVPEVSPLDVPVTLTVELGRVNLTVSRLAGLKPGDVIELSRHSRAPVELTSNGRLVARGELILIDTDLGVRITSVFL
jgi:flagellar motor switch protein FliN